MQLHYFTVDWRDEETPELVLIYQLASGDELHVHTRPHRWTPAVQAVREGL